MIEIRDILAIAGGIFIIIITVWLIGSLVSWIVARSKRKEILLNYAANNTESIYDELITIKQIEAEYKRMWDQKDKIMFEKLTQIGDRLDKIEQQMTEGKEINRQRQKRMYTMIYDIWDCIKNGEAGDNND